MPLKKIVILANLCSRTLDKVRLESAIQLVGSPIPVSVVFSEYSRHISSLAAEYGSDKDTLVAACGGDGAVFECLNGLSSSSTMGIIPAGTANAIAKELGIPTDYSDSVKALLTGAVTKIDTGRVGSKRFLMVAGFGFDAHVAANVPSVAKRTLGRLAYHFESLRRFPFYKAPELSIRIDGTQTVCGKYAIFANMRRYGGDLFFAPDARYDDGLIDLVLFRKFSPVDVIKGVAGAWSRKGVPADTAITVRGKRFELFSDQPTSFQLDGEVQSAVSSAEISVEPFALSIVIP